MAVQTAKQKEAAAKAAKAAKGAGPSKESVKVQSKELAVNKKSELAISTFASQMEEDAGAGMESFDRNDLAIPRISLIQSNSPQVKKAEGKFIKGAEEGDFLDSVTNEVFAKGEAGMLFIVCSYRRTDIEWIPRKKGGGFVADHGSDSDVLSRCTKDETTGAMLLPNGNEVVTTAEYIGIAIDSDGQHRQVAISLAKTGLKVARRLNTVLTTLTEPRANGQGRFNPAFFFSYFKVTSVPAQSKSGESYMAWTFAREGKTVDLEDGEELYMQARALRESFNNGTIKVATQTDDAAPEVESDDSKL